MKKIFLSSLLIVMAISLSGCETAASQTSVTFTEKDLSGQNDPIVHKRTGESIIVGYHDGSNCQIGARGWVEDLNFTGSVKVGFWLDRPANSVLAEKVGEVTADLFRPDLPFEDKDHGFSWNLPDDLKNRFYTLYAYALDEDGKPKRLLNRSAKEIYCGDREPLPSDTIIKVMVESLNVRSAPRKNSYIRRTLVKGMGLKIISIHEDDNGSYWYKVVGDSRHKDSNWYISANPIFTKEMVPRTDIAPVPDTVDRWTEVDSTSFEKTIRAIEKDSNGVERVVMESLVSTGVGGCTPKGTFWITNKDKVMVCRMNGEGYDLWGIFYTQYFFGDYALHDRWWRKDVPFGGELSHGCVNLQPDVAEWLWYWVGEDTVRVVIH